MKVIDAHTHIFPTKIEAAAVRSISEFYDTQPMSHRGLSEDLIQAGARIGAERFLVFSAATVPHQVENINNFIMSECAKHPQFMGAGTMHEAYRNAEAEIDRLKQNGLYGIKLHPDFQRFNFDSPALDETYRALSERGMFVITHAGDHRYDYSHPDRIANIARRYPKLRIIAAHFGGLYQWQAARDNLLTLPNVYIDTSSTLGFDAYDEARAVLRMIDPSHVFFATDFPMWDHVEELKRVERLGFTPRELENVLYHNFDAFYAY